MRRRADRRKGWKGGEHLLPPRPCGQAATVPPASGRHACAQVLWVQQAVREDVGRQRVLVRSQWKRASRRVRRAGGCAEYAPAAPLRCGPARGGVSGQSPPPLRCAMQPSARLRAKRLRAVQPASGPAPTDVCHQARRWIADGVAREGRLARPPPRWSASLASKSVPTSWPFQIDAAVYIEGSVRLSSESGDEIHGLEAPTGRRRMNHEESSCDAAGSRASMREQERRTDRVVCRSSGLQ